MTIDELLARESIRKTLAAYNSSGDRARFDEMMEQFTEDGVIELPGGARYEGRDAIRGALSGVKDTATKAPAPEPNARPAMTFLRHNITTCHIELTGENTASVRTYYNCYTDIGPDHCGYYADTFRKVGDRWLIAHRKCRLDWSSPDSMMGGRR